MIGRSKEPEVPGVPQRYRTKRRRTRRLVYGGIRLVVWVVMFAAVFVAGIGVGRIATKDEQQGNTGTVTIEGERGQLTATLPTTTVIKTKTVRKVVRQPARSEGENQ